MKLPLLLLLLLAASAQCFYVYLQHPLPNQNITVKMTLNGNETLLAVSGTEETKSPWISAADSVRFAPANEPRLWVTMTPGPVGLPPLLQLTTNYTVGIDDVFTGSPYTMFFQPRGIFPEYVCKGNARCMKMPPIGPIIIGNSFSEVVLFTTDYDIDFSLTQ